MRAAKLFPRILSLLCFLLGTRLPAQSARIRLLESGSRLPIAGAVVRLIQGDSVVTLGLTDELGRTLLRAPGPGSFLLRVARIGFSIDQTWGVTLSASEETRLSLFISGAPAVLPTVVVSGASHCGGANLERSSAAALWGQARAALEATRISERTPLKFRRRHFTRELSPEGVVKQERQAAARIGSGPPFVSLPANQLMSRGFSREDRGEVTYFAPDATLLLSDTFVESYCFRLVPPPDSVTGWTGLAFTSARPVSGRTDVDGVLWLDRETSELRSLEFRYVEPNRTWERAQGGGFVGFQRHPRGGWYVHTWAIRTPRLGRTRTSHPTLGAAERTVVIGFVESGGYATPDLSDALATRALLTGLVFDSLAGRGLPGVTVRLAGMADSAVTDSLGTFSWVVSVLGRRLVTFHHELFMLVPPRAEAAVDLRNDGTAHVVATLPAPRTLAMELCGGKIGSTGLVGAIASPAPGEGIEVEAMWYARGGIADLRRTTEVTMTGARGLWAFCDLEGATTVTVHQRAGQRRYAPIRIDLPPGEFGWKVLDSRLTGSALSLSGMVLDRETQHPLVQADVISLVTDAAVTSRQDGSFTLSNLPAGHQRFLVRYPGYEPVDTTIEFGDEPVEGVIIALKRMAAILPDIVVEGERERVSPKMRGFADRRLATFGRFLTRETLAKQEHTTLALLLDRIPRVRMVRAGNQVAAASGLRISLAEVPMPPPWPPACYMAVYLDGVRMWSPGGANPRPYDLNQHPLSSLEGIEVYTGADTPPEFSGTGAACGVIVL